MTDGSPTFEPQAGDILIHRTTASPPRYVVNALPGPPQAAYETYDQAVASVTRFATAQRIDVWYTDDHRAFRRVIARRLPASR